MPHDIPQSSSPVKFLHPSPIILILYLRYQHKQRILPMKGIQYLTDENGARNAVVIDLKRYKDLWEDFQDAITAKIAGK